MQSVKGVAHARQFANRKHQQRTPLPPRTAPQKTPADLAEERAVEAKAVKALPPKRKPPARGVPVRAVPTTPAKASVQGAVAAPKVSKARAFSDEAEAAGWSVDRIAKKGSTIKTVIATRGTERLEVSWDGERSASPLGSHSIGDHSEKLTHVSVARRMLLVPADVALNSLKTTKVTRAGVTTTKTAVRRVSVPFDPAEATDAEVLSAVAGKSLVWRNQFTEESGSTEAATCPRTGKHTKLDSPATIGSPAQRVLSFADANGEGFRSLRLDSIITVG